MKSKKHIRHHPNQKDKNENASYGSSASGNASTNKSNNLDVNMPQGAESEYREELQKSKTRKVERSFSKQPKQ